MDAAQLSQPARIALVSLRDHPHLDTADAINTGPSSIEQIDTPQIIEGLAELEALRLAVQSPGGAWKLTEAGRGLVV
jgi:hypothetical protein